MNADNGAIAGAWAPARGTWEEAVLSWHEQLEAAFRVKPAASLRQTGRTFRSAPPTSIEEVASGVR